MRRGVLRVFVVLLVACAAIHGQAQPRQAVVETSLGTFIIDLTSEAAPNQVAYFTKVAQEGGYDGTTFHTMVRNGMVQGGDPISKDPAKRSVYGTGGQTSRSGNRKNERLLAGQAGGQLNYRWVSALMALDPDWTTLPDETLDRLLAARRTSGVKR